MCGPTVYDSAHLGHARTYVCFDFIKRIMRDYFGYNVFLAMNITDIDDKIIMRSSELGEEFHAFAKKWEADYFEDMAALNVELPHVITRVSEFVPEIVDMTKKIIDNGFAYESNGSVYFDTAAFEAKHNYRKLVPKVNTEDEAALNEELQDAEGKLSANLAQDKKNGSDFALWKKSKEGEPHWDSPWGEGRPGWHIECSAMASQFLPCPMDIHSGGIDLRFPHHDNELAQSEAYFDNDEWVRYFMHTGHLNIDGLKMSKSLKNFITIKNMLKTYNGRHFRMLFLNHHWNAPMNFRPPKDNDRGSMGEAVEKDKYFREFILGVKARLRDSPVSSSLQKWGETERNLQTVFSKAQEDVNKALLDNFNTPEAVQALCDLIRETYGYMKEENVKQPLLSAILDYVTFVLNSFGLNYETDASSLTPIINALSEFRDDVRKSAIKKDSKSVLQICDDIRDNVLPFLGIRLEDQGGDKNAVWKFGNKDELIQERERKIAEQAAKDAKKAEELRLRQEKEAEQEAKAKIVPSEMFKSQTELYSAFDDKGLPTHNAEGEEISKSQKKNLAKAYAKQEKIHNQWLEKQKKQEEEESKN